MIRFCLRLRRGSIASVAVAMIALSILHACVVANGLRVPQRDASVAATPDAAPPDNCNHARIPTQPGPEARGEGVSGVFAMSAVDFGSADAGGDDIGFDLDGVCTCFDAGVGLEPVPEVCVPLAKTLAHCDGNNGRDNQIAQMFNRIPTGGISFDSYINGLLREARGGLLFVLDKYNGKADDDQVFIGVLPSRGKYRLVDGGTDGASEYVDADTTKRWSIAPDSYVIDGVTTPRRLAAGWVRDGTLVVAINPRGIPLVGLELVLNDAYLIAPLNFADPSKPLMERGTIVGRWDVKNLTAAAGRFVVSLAGGTGGAPLCEQPVFYDGVFKPAICGAADITTDPAEDNKGKPCSAVSLAMNFRVEPAEIGDFVDVEPAASCPPGSIDLVCPK